MVPDAHVFALEILESSNIYPSITLVAESSLFDGVVEDTWHNYALQMALKLLVARHVTTEHYITLDADVVVVGNLSVSQLLPGGKAAQATAFPNINQTS